MSNPCVFVISAPSGTGKSTVIKALLDQSSTFALSVSYTTRLPRLNEVHGRDYFFTTPDQFEELKEQGAFLEYTNLFDHHYGTNKFYIKELLYQGKNIILDLDLDEQGVRDLKKNKDFPSLVTIFIMPPSLKTLRERLVGRQSDTKSGISRRMDAAEQHMRLAPYYDYEVINDDLDRCVSEIWNIMQTYQKGYRPFHQGLKKAVGK